MKTCTRCREEKPLSEYAPEKRWPGVLVARCKQCTRDVINEYRQEHPEKGLEFNEFIIKLNDESRNHATSHHQQWTQDEDDLITVCYIEGEGIADIAEAVGRTISATRGRLSVLGVKRAVRVPYRTSDH
jgi:hypothetical protein